LESDEISEDEEDIDDFTSDDLDEFHDDEDIDDVLNEDDLGDAIEEDAP